MTARMSDLNGFITVMGNPISKEGVFQYSGAQIGHPDPSRQHEIFNVYRPASELSDPECIESFKLLPFTDEHAMLGAEDMGGTPAERKGVHGWIGEQVTFDPPYLRANLKIVSESLKNAIDNGKIELSPGYRCIYDFTPGAFNGQQYDAVQRRIRGNHLALVQEGRTGPDVAVLDRMSFTVDSKTIMEAAMADEDVTIEGGSGLEKIKALIAELKPLLAEQAEANELLAELGLSPAASMEPEAEVVADVEPELAPVADVEPEVTAMDVALVRDLAKRVAALESGRASMDAALVSGLADRDTLASKLSGFVGTFDSARMTVQGVAEYGVGKLGIKCPKGTERVALDAWLHDRTPEHKKPGITVDSSGVDLLKSWGAK